MKKILLLLLLVTGFASAQIINIPDTSFKSELINDGVDTNNDGEIQQSEALAITSMSLQSPNIMSLTGLEAFINLENFESDPNQVAVLDFAANVNLISLSIQAAIPPNVGSLSSINIAACTALESFLISASSITTLDCSSNVNLTALYIAGNPLLETVFIKNGSDESANMGSGSWMENWFPSNNPSLQYVCADNFQTTEIQQFAGTDYPVNSFCTFPPGGEVNAITGVTKFDDESDGCDAGDSTIPYTSFNIEFNGSPTNAIAYSNAQGVYNVYAAEAGTYSLFPNLENPNYFNINPPSADILFPIIDNSIETQDFCAEANGIHQDLEVVIAPITPARPGFEATYRLVYKNKGNQTLSGDVQFNFPENQMDFVSSSTTPNSQGAGTITFNFTDLQPYQTETIEIVLDVNDPMDTPPVNIGDILVLFTEINPVAGDEMPNDNFFTLDQIVIGSFDPNNIVCLQGEEVPTNYIGDFLHYVINFENTGTAPAENVVVTMEINPDDFDSTSLQILNISHDVQIRVYNNLAEFHFQNINLDTGGHGNILLKMKTKSDLNSTDNVGAKANIYFDYNFPVETNEAVTTFSVLRVDEYNNLKIVIFPNPANDLIRIQSASVIKNIGIYDLQGRLIDARTTNKQITELNISALKSGVYFLSIETEKGTGFKKIIKN
ncbi:T9SS type A sorting domain-containing protein [Aequorivita viscosa]|nr:T9SS type A sorting domain-containing protein [Aequorivita viscosa]